MIVRQATTADFAIWAAMLAKLHPRENLEEFEAGIAQWTALPDPYVCFLAFNEEGMPIGMIDARVRNYAEGAPHLAAAYLEDLYVEPEYRGRGVASRLLDAVEQWARAEGHDWLGSDALLDNSESHAWHLSWGFEEIERLVVFGKPLR